MKYGFIGTGTMGGTLAGAVCKAVGGADVIVCDRHASRAQQFAAQHNCRAADSATVVGECDYIFIGVKPQAAADMFANIADMLAARKTRFILISMVAGTPIASIRKMAGRNYPVIRIMPNTPAFVGQGMILYDCADVTAAEEETFLQAMSSAGKLDSLPEKLIDAGTAVSGCAPAYVYMFIEALADGGVECGLPRAKALEYAVQTVLGSAQMVLQSGQHPEKLKDDVCSPGGMTIAGVHALEDGGFRAAAINAVCAGFNKTKEL